MLIFEKIIKELIKIGYTNTEINQLIKNKNLLKETIEAELGYYINEIY